MKADSDGPVLPVGAASDVTIVVCAACRNPAQSDADPRPGTLLAAATRHVAGDTLRVRAVECLGNCRRRLSAAILREGCWSYVFGDLMVEDGPDLVAAARLYAGSADRLMPWRGRPDKLKRRLVSRIPPLTALKEIP